MVMAFLAGSSPSSAKFVVAWGGGIVAKPGLADVVAVSGGYLHDLALKGGKVVAWGENAYGQTNVPSGLAHVSKISAGYLHNLALKADGTVAAWGNNANGQTNVPPGLAYVVAVAAGGDHSLALKVNGKVVAWGMNNLGQTNVPPGLANVKAIAAGGSHSLALKSDGSIVGWGANGYGQATPPEGNDFVAIAAGGCHSLAIREASGKYGGGTGDPNDPYLIYTAKNLDAIGADPNDWDKHFKLMADIDLSGYSYEAALIAPDADPCDLSFIGTSFTGVLDGNGHKISNLTITGEYYLGLFGKMESGDEIKNLGLTDVNITGSQYVGSLAVFNKGRHEVDRGLF